jgi:uncharacterized SAM-binding protein YcdF (DUF218 family)
MFFILSKIMYFLFTPIIWIAVSLLWGIFSKNQLRKKRILISAVIVFFVFSNELIFNLFMHSWETPAVSQKQIPKYEVGIVLGGLAWYDFQLDRIQFVGSADRVFQGVELYKKGFIKKIFISGGSGSVKHPEMIESKFVKDYFVSIGIPAEDILIEYNSQNTHQNAVETKKVLDSLNIKGKQLLITSGFHLPRAKKCFDKVGLICDVYATDRYTGEFSFSFEALLVPDARILGHWNVLVHEWIGYATYKVMGYI